MLGECILSAPTKEKFERLINEYYCVGGGILRYIVDGNLIFDSKNFTHLDTVYVVRLKNGRYQLRRWIKDGA